MSRKRGRIVLVGVVNMSFDRSDFYEKELNFQVSCSYGPGRYDSSYEEAGRDYPFGFVRWTEQRNFEAILDNMAAGSLDVRPLISDRIKQADAGKAYDHLMDDSSKLALVLTYPAGPPPTGGVIESSPGKKVSRPARKVVAGVIGAGNFAKIVMLPALRGLGIQFKTVADINGVAGAHAARKFDFELVVQDYKAVLEDPEINTVFITTRHDLHAPMVIEALEAGKHVHVECSMGRNILPSG